VKSTAFSCRPLFSRNQVTKICTSQFPKRTAVMADTTADYVVIGAGLAGLTAARALSQLGGKGKVLTSFSTATTGTNRFFLFHSPTPPPESNEATTR
jgi:NADPH-dependent 2,4-dienoyl-CoA reductase/sulfur reductase-like enzyme